MISWLFLGVALGARHAFEPDHLAAVSNLVVQKKQSGFWLGALWGLGHSASLMLVAGSLCIMGAQLPPQVEYAFEMCVAAMVILLGARSIVHSFSLGELGESHPHQHGEHQHVHPAATQHVHVSSWVLASRPLFIGLLHGLAGSGALTALVLAKHSDSLVERLVSVFLFGFGSTLGMGGLTFLAKLSLRPHLLQRWMRVLQSVAGVGSVLVGLHLVWSHS